jgi:hypothetical protein
MKYEWNNTNAAMWLALSRLVDQILTLPNCEESARAEAVITRQALDTNPERNYDQAWLTDKLHQTLIDLAVNERKVA